VLFVPFVAEIFVPFVANVRRSAYVAAGGYRSFCTLR